MWTFLRSLRFRLLVLPAALLALCLILALIGMIGSARQRVSAEVRASAALARALISAVSANTADPVSTLREVEKHMPPTRHVHLGISNSQDSAIIAQEFWPAKERWVAPGWFVSLIAERHTAELVNVAPAGTEAHTIYIMPDPSDEIREVWQEFRFIAVLCTTLAGVIIGSALWMASEALRPIRKLGDGLERLQLADFTANLPPVRFSELEKIRTQFHELARSLRDKTLENKKLYEKLVSTQESERKHVSRELHDELGPCLFGVRAETASIRQSLKQSGRADSDIAARVAAIDNLVDTIQQINRRILHTVQPAALSEGGLAAALRDIVDGWQETYPKITWRLDFNETELDDVPKEASLALYRLVQEGLTNIARHSQCTEAEVTIARSIKADVKALEVIVSDNGRGFSPQRDEGSGLQGMRERIHRLGGDFIVDGAVGAGVTIRALIPLAEAA